MSLNENNVSNQGSDKSSTNENGQTNGSGSNESRQRISRNPHYRGGVHQQEFEVDADQHSSKCYGTVFPPCQYFKQHRPFSSDAGPLPPGAHLFQPPQFPHDLPIRFLNLDGRRCKRRFHNHAESLPSSGVEVNNGNQSMGFPRFSFSPENGARLKVVSTNQSRKKHYRRKRNCNNSSKERQQAIQRTSLDFNKENNALLGDVNGRSGEMSVLPSSVETGMFCEGNFTMQMPYVCDSQDPSHFASEIQMEHLCSEIGYDCNNKASNDCVEEGAIGGVAIHEQHADFETSNQCNYVDKDSIDEGAICDFDKMFQNQEFARCHGNGLLSSDDDCDEKERLSSFPKNTGAISGDDSEQENGEYDHGSQSFSHLRKGFHTSCEPKEFLKTDFSSQSNTDMYLKSTDTAELLTCSGTKDKYVGKFDYGDRSGFLPESDGGEDTGDFIDTDLPSYNKHILSSSDEMDNLSSGNTSEKEVGYRESPSSLDSAKKCSDYNCNDLSFYEPKLLNGLESLTVSNEAPFSVPASLCKSHTAAPFIHSVDSGGKSEPAAQVKHPFADHERHASGSGSSSGSENGETCILNFSIPVINPVDVHRTFEDTGSSSLDEAAASQLPSLSCVKSLQNSFSCPRGAESGIPPHCHSHYIDPMNSGVCLSSASTISSCLRKNASYSSAQGHAALTASSEQMVPPPSYNRSSVVPGSASGSFSTESSACCADDACHVQVNNLNAYCHHVHGHIANGFNDDTGANFSNDESNQQKKIFRKLTLEDNTEDEESHSASSADKEEECYGTHEMSIEREKDNGGPEESPDSGDSVDTVLLPMQEEIEPMHYMGSYCAGGGGFDSSDEDDISGGLDCHVQAATNGRSNRTNSLFDEQQLHYTRDQNRLGTGMPSKEFYELIKSVSTSDSYMRFFDKDGHDVQRKTYSTFVEDGKAESGQESSSKADRLKVDRVMIWNEYEAYVVQFKQIAVSACGQTAVLNVMKALKFNCDKAAVCKVIKTSLRKEDADIPEYLFSRAAAGTTATELIAGVVKLSGGTVGGRFFQFWPPRKVKLLQWLAYWMKRGAIPVATLNLQLGPHSIWQIPDSWHHQMVYGVSHQGLYLTNPLEIVSERSAMKQLCSDSMLLVRRHDIVTRFRETTDLGQLLEHSDPRWMSMNVLGQVVNVLREFNMPSVPGYRLQVTAHVSIPVPYRAGITLYMCKDRPAWSSLVNAPDLPLEPAN